MVDRRLVRCAYICVGRALRRYAIAACVHVRRTLGNLSSVHTIMVAAIGEDSLMMIVEI